MEIIVHKQFVLQPPGDVHVQYAVPIWEIEIKSNILDSDEFESSLRDANNFRTTQNYNSDLRSVFCGSGLAADLTAFLNQQNRKQVLLDIVGECSQFRTRFPSTVEQYYHKVNAFGRIFRDDPLFTMKPHIDNNHIMAQMIVNLLQDNTSATEFYNFNETTACYQAPLKKNHGVLFLNTPGSVHCIRNIDQPRWILYGGLMI